MLNNINYVNKILELKRKKDVLVLAHYYTDSNVQEIADFIGDSYYLGKIAQEQSQNTIIFCGVKFMAESSKIMSPHKKIILPDFSADCPMAHMATAKEIQNIRNNHQDLAVVCYINSTAAIKALSDVCVTSSNAIKVISQLKEKNIFFIPDQHLGRHIAKQLPDKNFLFGHGYCHVHTNISKEHLIKLQQQMPAAVVVAHPECSLNILEHADFIGSTSGIINHVFNSEQNQFIVCTEEGILHTLKKQNPNKEFYLVENKQICPDMKKITLEKVYQALLTLNDPIEIDKDLAKQAQKPLERMYKLANT